MSDFLVISDTKPAVVRGGGFVQRINALALVVVKLFSQHPRIGSAYGDGTPVTL